MCPPLLLAAVSVKSSNGRCKIGAPLKCKLATRKLISNYLLPASCHPTRFFIASEPIAGLQSWCGWYPLFEPIFNEQGARLGVRCAMLRHAEMPEEPRRVPTVMSGFIGGPSGTAPRVGF